MSDYDPGAANDSPNPREQLIEELRAVAKAPTMMPTWRIRLVLEQAANWLTKDAR